MLIQSDCEGEGYVFPEDRHRVELGTPLKLDESNGMYRYHEDYVTASCIAVCSPDAEGKVTFALKGRATVAVDEVDLPDVFARPDRG